MTKWRKEPSLKLAPDLLERLSYLLGIYKALHILLPNRELADGWIRRPNADPLFGGRTPLARMLSGRVADLFVVRRFRVESLTNDRLRDQVGELSLVPTEDRVSGAGSSYVMAAFTHAAPVGGRFTDETFGAFYTARDRQTAIDETVFHRERFLRDMAAPPTELDMRVLRAKLNAVLHDLRGRRGTWPELYRLDDYSASQAAGRALRASGSWGIAYESVQGAGGECAAVLRPPAITRCRQAEHLGYVWDGEQIALAYEKNVLRDPPN